MEISLKKLDKLPLLDTIAALEENGYETEHGVRLRSQKATEEKSNGRQKEAARVAASSSASMSLAGARNVLLNARRFSDNSCIVAFSGGKDSFVCLDLATQIFGKVYGMFWYQVKGLRCEETLLRYAERRYGIEIIRLPHQALFCAFRDAAFMPHVEGWDSVRDVHQRDLESIVRVKTGADWVIYGYKLVDSLERRAMIKRIRGFDLEFKRAYPIWDWKVSDVYAYIRARGICIPETFGGRNMGGVSLRPDRIALIKKYYPDDYEKIKQVFPFIEIQLKRYEYANANN